jgi:hypothetical protein
MQYRVPWWVIEGEEIDATALSNRKLFRERNRSLGLPAGYDTFWGFIDVDPVSVVPTLRTANVALDWRDLALQRLSVPRPLTLTVGVVVAAAAMFGIVGGSSDRRMVAVATSLIVGVMIAVVVPRFAIMTPSRLAAIGVAAALGCVAVSAVPAIHVTRLSDILVGLAFVGAGLAVAALWPIAQAWRIEREHWKHPDVALVASLLKFSDCVESDPASEDRRRAVAALDRAATRFELSWHHVNRTGVDVTDRQLRAWASRIRAETRELQRWFAFGAPSTIALLMHTYELIQAIVNRYSLDDHEDAWIRHGSWHRPPTSTLARLWARSKVSGRYVRQCLLAGLIATTASLLLADTVWSAVSTFIGTHLSRSLGSALNFDPTVRVFVATISLSLFAVAGRAFTRRQ